MLAELAVAVGADLTILDAVVGMDGDGPGGGRVHPFEFIALGPNPFSIDALAAELFGIAPKLVPALESGMALGVAPESAKEIDILCHGNWRDFLVSDFLLPAPAQIKFRIPTPIFRLLRRFLTPQPKIDRRRCVRCNACVEACPTNAIENNQRKIVIRYRDCISCYCCAEVCPHKAVRIRTFGLNLWP